MLLDSLLAEPFADLVIGDHRGAGAIGDRGGVGHVVEVAVRDENEIGLNRVGLDRRRGRIVQERIDQDRAAGALTSQQACPSQRNVVAMSLKPDVIWLTGKTRARPEREDNRVSRDCQVAAGRRYAAGRRSTSPDPRYFDLCRGPFLIPQVMKRDA